MINQNTESKINYMDIWTVNLPLNYDSHVQGGSRPALIVSNDDANASSSVVTIVPLTKNQKRIYIPANVPLEGFGLDYPSLALCEQIQTVDKHQLRQKIGTIDDPDKVVALKAGLMAQMNLTA